MPGLELPHCRGRWFQHSLRNYFLGFYFSPALCSSLTLQHHPLSIVPCIKHHSSSNFHFFLMYVEFSRLSFRLPSCHSWDLDLVIWLLNFWSKISQVSEEYISSISTSKNTCSHSLDWDFARAIPDRKELLEKPEVGCRTQQKVKDLHQALPQTSPCSSVRQLSQVVERDFGLVNNFCLMNTRLLVV